MKKLIVKITVLTITSLMIANFASSQTNNTKKNTTTTKEVKKATNKNTAAATKVVRLEDPYKVVAKRIHLA